MNNKYQEALDFIVKSSCPQGTTCKKCSFNMLCNSEAKYYVDKLQELVDKATPKKPLGLSLTHDGRVGNCPFCKKLVRERSENICECGQKLNWSE